MTSRDPAETELSQRQGLRQVLSLFQSRRALRLTAVIKDNNTDRLRLCQRYDGIARSPWYG
jgi:hypothetical protein